MYDNVDGLILSAFECMTKDQVGDDDRDEFCEARSNLVLFVATDGFALSNAIFFPEIWNSLFQLCIHW